MKNIINKKKIIGISGYNSFLASSFIKEFKKQFIFKKYSNDINDHKKFDIWVKNNKNLNYFINFAAAIGSSSVSKNIDALFKTNFHSATMLMDTINSNKLKKFEYFLALSTSHVFKKSQYKLKESSVKLPNSNYGKSKLKMEKYIIRNKQKYFFKIGIARIFNYYNLQNKHNFINDVLKKLKNNNMIVEFKNVDTYRDFMHLKDVVGALDHMIKLKLTDDYNICSGEKIYLKDMICNLNLNIKNKKVIFKGKKTKNLIGSNHKLKKTKWKCEKIFNHNQLFYNLNL